MSAAMVALLGDVSSNKLAIWVCGVVLTVLLGAIIAKSKERDLRFLTCCVLVSIFAILGFAYISSHDDAPAKVDAPPSEASKAEVPVVSGANVSIAHALGFIVVELGSVTTITLGSARNDSSTCGKYSNRQDANS